MVFTYKVDNPKRIANLKSKSLRIQGRRSSTYLNKNGEYEVWEHTPNTVNVYVYRESLPIIL